MSALLVQPCGFIKQRDAVILFKSQSGAGQSLTVLGGFTDAHLSIYSTLYSRILTKFEWPQRLLTLCFGIVSSSCLSDDEFRDCLGRKNHRLSTVLQSTQ